jgi:fumarate hydratase subunit alpha
VKVDPRQIEEAAKELYIRALKLLPPDVKQGFAALAKSESDAGAKRMLGTMIRNIAVAEDTDNLLCQDTGIPIYNVWIGRGIELDGIALKEAIRRGCEMIPKGSGSENNSWLRMAVPAEGVDAIKTFVVDCVLDAGGKTCPPTIVGVGVGGTADLCVHLAKLAATRPLGSRCEDPEGAQLEDELTQAVNLLGVGPQGLGGDSTAFAVHVETAATHITMNPVAVNMQCHSARRARATFSAKGIEYGF